jgi:hypothetical protein
MSKRPPRHNSRDVHWWGFYAHGRNGTEKKANATWLQWEQNENRMRTEKRKEKERKKKGKRKEKERKKKGNQCPLS